MDTKAMDVTFACTHRGGPYPMSRWAKNRSRSMLPSAISTQLCYDCSAIKACNWITEKEAIHNSRIKLLKLNIQHIERRLSQERQEPTHLYSDIDLHTDEIEECNRRWQKSLVSHRQKWDSTWGDQIPPILEELLQRSLTRAHFANIRES